jgi:hypothetical protein
LHNSSETKQILMVSSQLSLPVIYCIRIKRKINQNSDKN